MNKQEVKNNSTVLVTGSTGFLGYGVVTALLGTGFKVRAFVRQTSQIEPLERLDVEIVIGDVGDLASLRDAVKGVDYIVHAAADTVGSVEGGKLSTVKGTENVVALCKECRIKKLVYISSCCVYGVVDVKEGGEISEESPLERLPDARGAYSGAKCVAERLIVQAMAEKICPIVCLRPGVIYGPGGEIFTPMMGFSLGSRLFVTIGNGNSILPLVYVDNVADAVRAVLERRVSGSNIYNLIDPYRLTKREYNERVTRKIFPEAMFVNIPYPLLYVIVYFQEVLLKIVGRAPWLTRYRLESSQKRIIYIGNKFCRELNWTPPVAVHDALENIVEFEMQRQI